MPRRSTTAVQAKALRTLADEIEAGTRELSPAMAKALDHELGREDDAAYEELAPDEWEEAWATEIDRRLADYRAGTAQKVDLGVVIEDLRSRLR